MRRSKARRRLRSCRQAESLRPRSQLPYGIHDRSRPGSAHPFTRPCVPPSPRQRLLRELGSELARACVEPPCDVPATADRDAVRPTDCYPRLLRPPASRRFPCTSADDLRHLRRAGRARCFTTPDPPECATRSTQEAFPPSLVAGRRPPGAPVARPIRGPGFREESRDAAPRWQGTLVSRAETASAVGP